MIDEFRIDSTRAWVRLSRPIHIDASIYGTSNSDHSNDTDSNDAQDYLLSARERTFWHVRRSNETQDQRPRELEPMFAFFQRYA